MAKYNELNQAVHSGIDALRALRGALQVRGLRARRLRLRAR